VDSRTFPKCTKCSNRPSRY